SFYDTASTQSYTLSLPDALPIYPMSGEDNLQRMKTLDDAWNSQNWDVFRKRHSADTAVFWPGQPDPTRGRDAHQAESEAFFKSRSEEHTSELQSRGHLVCRLLLA